MSDKTSAYPISQLIAKIIRNSGYTTLGYNLAMGTSEAEAGLADLDSWLENGEGAEGTIARIASFDPEDAERLHKAVAETAAMKAAGVDPAAFERERREREEEDRFRPFVQAHGERTVPTQITMFAVTGGQFLTIQLPTTIVKLPLEEQLAKVRESMAEYKRRHKGQCPFFGKLVGFTFVRWRDYFRFDADGELLEHVEGKFQGRVVAWVELR